MGTDWENAMENIAHDESSKTNTQTKNFTNNNNMNNGPEPMSMKQNTRKNEKPEFTLVNLISRLDTQISLSEKGMEYHKALRAGLEDTSNRIGLKCERLNEQSYLFHDGNGKGIVIVYTETQLNDDESVLSMYGRVRSLAYELFGVYVLNVIGVHPEDYDKVAVMITDIKNTFITDSPEFNDFNIKSLNGIKFSIDQNIERVKTFVRAVSPHGVPAAFDMGFTVNMLVEKNKNQQFVINNNDNRGYDVRPIAAVLGKVNFVCNYNSMSMPSMFGGNQAVFLPNIVITDIISPIKLSQLIPFFISMAYHVFIGYGAWKNCFKQFGVKGAMNIGNLMENQATHTLVELTNDADVEAFIAQFCKNPILTISVNEGRVRIPGMENFAEPTATAWVSNILNNFLGVTINSNRIVLTRTPEYVGTTTIRGELCDSRYVDYLRIVAETPNEAANVRSLMMNYINPMDRYKFIKSIAPDTSVVKYMSYGCTLYSDVLSIIADAIAASSISINIDGTISNQFMDSNILMNESNNYANMQQMRFNNNNFVNYNYANSFGYKM